MHCFPQQRKYNKQFSYEDIVNNKQTPKYATRIYYLS